MKELEKINDETDIDKILDLMSKDTFFISDWNKSDDGFDIPNKYLLSAKENIYYNKNEYLFSDEFENIKSDVAINLNKSFNYNLSKNEFCILPNGTSSVHLCILMLKKYIKGNALLITPTYFIYSNIFKQLDIKHYYYNFDIFNKAIELNIMNFEETIIKNKIELIVITDPLFGTGISVNASIYDNIILICQKHSIWLFIDYMYGGMEWLNKEHILNYKFIKYLHKYNKIIIIESISKRLFLNGIKNCIIYADPEIIHRLEKMSVSFLGSLTCTQIDVIKEIYSETNICPINKLIQDNINKFILNYHQINSLTLGCNCFLSSINSGYFFLMGIPYSNLENKVGYEVVKDILCKTNILTVPHERYGINSSEFYTFRVNLALKRENLFVNINSLLNSYF